MKIYFDNIIYTLQKAGGISTYWGEVSKRLLRDNVDILFIENNKDLNIVRNTFEISRKLMLVDRNYPIIINRFLSIMINNMETKFIFHSSYNRLVTNKNALSVVTIHDFVHEKFYTGMRKFLHSYQKKKCIESAKKIIVVSENTKKDLLFFYPQIDPHKIKVIYNGVSEDFFKINAGFELKILDNKPYILFIGSREHYKNFKFAVQILQELHHFNFCIVGSPLKKNEEEFLNTHLKGRWQLFTNINNSTLNKIYNKAYLLLYPSSYEGFGIPLLEAMKAGTPFIALNKSSIPEVAGNAGILVENLDLNEFKEAILSVSTRRVYLINEGILQANKFSWEKCYQATLKVYQDLYNS